MSALTRGDAHAARFQAFIPPRLGVRFEQLALPGDRWACQHRALVGVWMSHWDSSRHDSDNNFQSQLFFRVTTGKKRTRTVDPAITLRGG